MILTMEIFRLYTAFLSLVLKVLPHQRDDSAATNYIHCSLSDHEFFHFTDLLHPAPVAASENACAALCDSMARCTAATYEWSTKRCHPSAVVSEQSATTPRDGINILIPVGSALSCGALLENAPALAAVKLDGPECGGGRCAAGQACHPGEPLHGLPATCVTRCTQDADCVDEFQDYFWTYDGETGFCNEAGICTECQPGVDASCRTAVDVDWDTAAVDMDRRSAVCTASGKCKDCAPEGNRGCGADQVCLPEIPTCIPRCHTDNDCTGEALQGWFAPADPYGHGVCMPSGICQQCNSTEDCPRVAPFCAVSSSESAPRTGRERGYNRCLECLDDTHCKEGASCTEGRCWECGWDNNRCSVEGDRRLCDFSTMRCIQCDDDDDCKGNANGPVCDYLNKRCGTQIGGCTDDAYCTSPAAKFCAVGTAADVRPGVCTECRPGMHEDCADSRTGAFCTEEGLCELCLPDGSGCKDDRVCNRRYTYDVKCVEPCTSDEHCSKTEGSVYMTGVQKWTCLEDGRCSECSSADDCAAGEECQLSRGLCRPAGKGCLDDSGCTNPGKPKCRRGDGCIELECDYRTGEGCSDSVRSQSVGGAIHEGADYNSGVYEGESYETSDHVNANGYGLHETRYNVYEDGYGGMDYHSDHEDRARDWSGHGYAYDTSA